jgi:lipopolysaccharide export LptBFGC system permease protein LptF
MIPDNRNIRERLSVLVVMLLGLAAIMLYTRAEPLPVMLAIAITFGVMFGLSNRWLANSIDGE